MRTIREDTLPPFGCIFGFYTVASRPEVYIRESLPIVLLSPNVTIWIGLRYYTFPYSSLCHLIVRSACFSCRGYDSPELSPRLSDFCSQPPFVLRRGFLHGVGIAYLRTSNVHVLRLQPSFTSRASTFTTEHLSHCKT